MEIRRHWPDQNSILVSDRDSAFERFPTRFHRRAGENVPSDFLIPDFSMRLDDE
jgi:hypothetical protein